MRKRISKVLVRMSGENNFVRFDDLENGFRATVAGIAHGFLKRRRAAASVHPITGLRHGCYYRCNQLSWYIFHSALADDTCPEITPR